ncbi:hypothetical protein HN014_16160 [Aquimarina sp. TRL1]|uniref:esterase-like activity of phytase family protein n=1 Tax=Aquimarina sp. (strain TRL1) TaxID=2736252 RepID=UPI00158D505B|nr:esterase-like activity of phytase family protein [Aquimarina sp. TRL1]QKX06381.1 hypothetical protein HN014_16160 [Aquimarina sp. TRL1]
MNRSYYPKSKIMLVVWCLTLLYLPDAINAQERTVTQKGVSLLMENTSPTSSLYKKIYPKGTGKSFYNFGDILVARAVLPAASFSNGPTSGNYIGTAPINDQIIPFPNKQPIQGFSAVLNNHDGTFLAMSDNGFGTIENSADYHLRIYTIRPNFKSIFGLGKGTIEIINHIELKDPNRLIPFAITNEFSSDRILTGADFDIESIQQTPNGDLWIGDEFGPFLLHFDRNGILLEAPYTLPDYDIPGKELRSPQNPFSEESSAIRIMNAMRAHAFQNGAKAPVMSPWYVMLDDENKATYVSSRKTPPSGLSPASSELFNVESLQKSGHPIVVYTVNDSIHINQLLDTGINGIISDRPDLLLTAIQNFDKNKDGTPDYIDKDGLIDINKFDAQGHRGARNLRPENTLPSMEAALDFLMPTLETDCGITKDGIPVLDHDPHIEAAKTRKVDGASYEYKDEVLVKDMTLASIQTTFIADKLLSGRPHQTNELSLSPVSVAYANQQNFIHPYIIPSLQQVFDFVTYYVAYYKDGAGKTHPEAQKRWKNAAKVRFNIETKINPRTDRDERGDVFSLRTVDFASFTKAIAEVIQTNKMEERADIQSFDFRTLLYTHKHYPSIRTVCLLGDFPKVENAGDGTNLQDQNGENTPWLAGMYWPYRSTKLTTPFKVKKSGGFEGMALSKDKRKLLPLLEKPLEGEEKNHLLIHEFDINSASYTGKKYIYPLHQKATAIGEFIMFSKKRGVIIERDGTQGDLKGFKAIYEIQLNPKQEKIKKKKTINLLKIKDIRRISEPGSEGDIGIGRAFAFPFVTIESVIVFNPFLIGVVNDNNYPFSVGRHAGTKLPDDNEFILVWLDTPLGMSWEKKNAPRVNDHLKVFPTTFDREVTFSIPENTLTQDHTTITINIYDLYGKQITSYTQKNDLSLPFSYSWNGISDNGLQVASGVYIAVIEINGEFIKRKIIKK